MYKFYWQAKSGAFRAVDGYQLQNGLGANKLHDQTWVITDILSGVKVVANEYTLAALLKKLNSDDIQTKLREFRASDSYKKYKKTMYDYVMGLKEKDRVDGWKRYIRGNK
jgi:hypothetical protein